MRHGVAEGEDGHRKVSGEIAATESPTSVFATLRRDKLALGRAAHCLILEGRMAFDDQYLVSDGPVNAKTGEAFGRTTKSYSDWLDAQTKEVLSCRDYGFITKQYVRGNRENFRRLQKVRGSPREKSSQKQKVGENPFSITVQKKKNYNSLNCRTQPLERGVGPRPTVRDASEMPCCEGMSETGFQIEFKGPCLVL